MTAVKKKLLIALAFVAMLFAGIALLSACSGNEDDLKVTFMVQEDGEWGSYREADIVDGSVEMPENPTKLYYNFSNWYYTQDGTGDPFENSGITESVTVYARFVPIEVEIVINGTNEGTQNLVDVVIQRLVHQRELCGKHQMGRGVRRYHAVWPLGGAHHVQRRV